MAVAATLEQTSALGTYEEIYEAGFSWRHEQRQSFDPMASVRMFRYDLEHFGQVLPETRERVHDEELSFIAEAVDRASRTQFALRRQGDDLTYYKNGQWQSYTGMLLQGLEVAKHEAQLDPRRQFLAEDAANDLGHLYQIRKLRPGQQYMWYSKYRKDIEDKYGAQFMRECGRFPDRQMGFLYRAYCNADGDVILESQTVDRAVDDEAFAAAMQAGTQGGDLSVATRAYDATLTRKYGVDMFAGRLDAEANENAWVEIQKHRDLIEFFLSKLEAIAAMPLHASALEEATKRHLYGTWAAFKRRLDGVVSHANYTLDSSNVPVAHLAMVEREVHDAFTDFARVGRPLVGCGGSIEMMQSEQNILRANAEDVYKAIFGEEETDQFGSLTFKCTEGHTNKRPRGKKISKCRIAGCREGSVGC